jgi:hypothetical protein
VNVSIGFDRDGQDGGRGNHCDARSGANLHARWLTRGTLTKLAGALPAAWHCAGATCTSWLGRIRPAAWKSAREATRLLSSAAGGQGPKTDVSGEKLMEDAQKARRREPGRLLLDWPDSGSIAVITWRTAAGDVHRQELASRREAEDLLAKIDASAELSLVSAQVRRVGIGPDS